MVMCSLKPFNHTQCAEVNPTDCPKSIRNRCIFEFFVAVYFVPFLFSLSY